MEIKTAHRNIQSIHRQTACFLFRLAHSQMIPIAMHSIDGNVRYFFITPIYRASGGCCCCCSFFVWPPLFIYITNLQCLIKKKHTPGTKLCYNCATDNNYRSQCKRVGVYESAREAACAIDSTKNLAYMPIASKAPKTSVFTYLPSMSNH